MEACCYILFSKQTGKYYTGACHNNLAERIKKHNLHEYGSHRYTATASDWELYLEIPVIDYSHAIRLERLIKSMKSSKYIENLKKYPEIISKIIIKTSN
jgi:putative endonuclease